MADEYIMNGLAWDGNVDLDADFRRSEMMKKMEELEQVKDGLARENDGIRRSIGRLTAEIEELRNDKERLGQKLGEMENRIEDWGRDKKALETIAARASELETEVSTLQLELISSKSQGEEDGAEVSELKGLLELKTLHLDNLEKERAGLRCEMEASEAELQSLVLQLKIEASERARAEEEANASIGEKDAEISELKKDIVELESVVEKSTLELADAKGKKNEKVAELESKLSKLAEELDESRRVIKELKEKAVQGVNGVTTAAEKGILGNEQNSVKVQWPTAVVASTGTVAAMGALMVYLHYAQRR